MMLFRKPANTPRSESKIFSKGLGAAKEIVHETGEALLSLTGWERAMHFFWLLGPFFLLIERSPADLWLSIIALVFAGRSVARREGWWLQVIWVRLAFVFWAVCLVSAALSPLPAYSLGEAFVWFRFPLFAMAVAFWLGRDKRFVHAMLVSIGLGMMFMCAILAAEILILGSSDGRLSWPYGDLVPGNYLAKACLPTFLVAVALATSSTGSTAAILAIMSMISLGASLMTGERINFLIRAFSGLLAAVVWRPKAYRLIALAVFMGVTLVSTVLATPGLLARYTDLFISQLPTHVDSLYFRAMAPGWLAFKDAPLFGVGPGNLRFVCEGLTAGSSLYDCHPHPHNYYIQILGEVGIIGLMAGVFFLGSIIWTCAKPARLNKSNVVVATMWIVPFAFFWPITSSADFFGQWNNIFMWSALSVALAGVHSDRAGQRSD